MAFNKGKRSAPKDAADAEAFEDIFDESTDAARTLDSDWMYQLEDQVFGPVKPRELLQMLYEGEITPDTLVALSDGEFQALRRIGVFRAHLPKVEAHKKKVAAEAAAAKLEARRRLLKRLLWVGLAVVVLVLASAGAVYGVHRWRVAQAEQEKEEKEAALRKELDDIYARVTISPPLMPVAVEPKAPPPGKKGRRGRRRRGKRGHAKAAAPVATGVLQKREIMQGVATVFGRFKRCIVQQIQRDPESVPERVMLEFSVGNNGRAKQVKLGDRFLRRSPMQGCMEAALRKVKWRAYTGEVQNIEYPITVGRH